DRQVSDHCLPLLMGVTRPGGSGRARWQLTRRRYHRQCNISHPKKKGPCGPLSWFHWPHESGGGGRLRPLPHRTRILAPWRLVALDDLDHRGRRVVAVAEPGLHDAQIAAVALLVARADHLEQLLDHRHVADLGDRLAPSVQVAALAERDQLLDDRAQLLRLGQRGGDLLVLDQRGRHVGEHGAAMLGRAVELAVGVTVTHRRGPSLYSLGVSNDPRSAWPALRRSRAAIPALPCRGGGPSGRALP